MEITTLSQDLENSSSENIRYDMACKRLLSQKIILAWILQGCVPEFKDSSVEEIVEKYIEGDPQVNNTAVMPDSTNTAEKIKGMTTEDASTNEGKIMYDIRFMASAPHTKKTISLIINVEAQNNFYPGYPLIKRGIYYCSRMISAQYGTVFLLPNMEKSRRFILFGFAWNRRKNLRIVFHCIICRKNFCIERFKITKKIMIYYLLLWVV